MINCERCGKCCQLPSGADCPFLVRFENGFTACRVYRDRIGRYIGEGQICVFRTAQDKIIDGCPYNAEIERLRAAIKEIEKK